MPAVRIYFFAYRRYNLLQRAISSLQAQTFSDWICELHNDAPDDEPTTQFFAAKAAEDCRFVCCPHAANLGPVRTFNLAFGSVAERYTSILEDDNWWEPGFLATLVSQLANAPEAAIAWSNMRVHEELQDGSWRDTGRTIWPEGSELKRFEWPALIQAIDALHSNGAMLCRTGRHEPVPTATPFSHIEAFRERTFQGSALLVSQPLAHFALTRSSARPSDRRPWLHGQLLQAGSFLRNVTLSPAAWDGFWRHLRQSKPRNTNVFLLLAIAGIARKEILKRAAATDWLHLFKSAVGHPLLLTNALGFRSANPELWTWLQEKTVQRIQEARARGFAEISEESPLAKT